jgi:hypothetical protein
MSRSRTAGWAVAAALHSAVTLAAGPGDCAGFSAGDAAAFLGVPAERVKREVRGIHATLHACSYAVDKAPPALAFSVEVAPNEKKAAADMERYRESLATAGETAPWKGKLPKGAYSDIMGVGDEGVWTDINGAYTVRKGAITLQFTRPADKREQVRLAGAVLKKR